ncbi:MAG TPA: hypothetical protein VK524_16085 [Polyangiaceae bacterium]|nr:hypothetical protein [Polyangiaceae bacterium]
MLLCALLTGAQACSAARTEAERPNRGAESAARPNPASTLDAGASRTAPSAADTEVQRALEQVAVVRELAVRGSVNAEILAQAAMVQRVREQLDREVPKPAIEASTDMLFGFGIVRHDFDLKQSLLDLMTTQLAGFYDPVTTTMYMSLNLEGPEREATLSHELVHALQDQHYDLRGLIAYREDASDAQTALHALAEGDATSAMMDYMLRGRGLRATDVPTDGILMQAESVMAADAKAAAVPGIIKRSVIASYADGLPFVHWARRRGGWQAVDAAWKSPPLTTEQLLHPEKYAAREPPLAVPVPLPSPSGPTRLGFRDVQGEQALRLLLEEWMPMKAARDAAAGWGGDRLAVYSDGTQTAVAWHIRYDDAASAERGLLAVARGILRKSEDPPSPGEAPDWISREEALRAVKLGKVCRQRHRRGIFAAVRHGSDIALVAGPFSSSRGQPLTSTNRRDCAEMLRWASGVAAQH